MDLEGLDYFRIVSWLEKPKRENTGLALLIVEAEGTAF
jgi:hypothetical protein